MWPSPTMSWGSRSSVRRPAALRQDDGIELHERRTGRRVGVEGTFAGVGADDSGHTTGYAAITLDGTPTISSVNYQLGSATLRNTLQLAVTAVAADNVENGREVVVARGGAAIAPAWLASWLSCCQLSRKVLWSAVLQLIG